MRPGRASSRAWRAKIRPGRAHEGAGMANRGGDVRKDGRTEGRTEGRTSGNSPLCPTGHRPFGAAAQKGSCPKFPGRVLWKKFYNKRSPQMTTPTFVSYVDIADIQLNVLHDIGDDGRTVRKPRRRRRRCLHRFDGTCDGRWVKLHRNGPIQLS